MKKVALICVGCLAALYVAAILVPFEPAERRPGTGLAGQLAAVQATDWSFVSGRTKIFVETRTWYLIPHSVTTVSWVVDGSLYVPCGNCAAKRWPRNVHRDPFVRIKVGDELFEREAVLVSDEAQRRRLLTTSALEPLPDGVAIYRMDPR